MVKRRYFFHVVDGLTIRDTEGAEYESDSCARNAARTMLRRLTAGDVARNAKIVVTDTDQHPLFKVGVTF